MQILAKIISILFQPIFIPLYGAVILSFGDPYLSLLPLNLKAYFWLIVFSTTGLFPAFIIGLSLKFGTVSDGFISKRRERPLPFFFSFLGYLFCAVWLSKAGLPVFYIAPIFGAAFALLVVILVTYSWKISAHLTAFGGLSGGIFAYSMISLNQFPILLIIAVIISGFVGWSRMVLKAHTVSQVCLGWLNGFIWVAVAWIILPIIYI